MKVEKTVGEFLGNWVLAISLKKGRPFENYKLLFLLFLNIRLHSSQLCIHLPGTESVQRLDSFKKALEQKEQMQSRIMHQDNSFINQAIALKEDFPNSLFSHLAYQKLSTELLKFLVQRGSLLAANSSQEAYWYWAKEGYGLDNLEKNLSTLEEMRRRESKNEKRVMQS